MTCQANIIHCVDCTHCFKSNRSRTGYKCEVWGYEDFADDTVLDGFCHKAKSKNATMTPNNDLERSRLPKGEQT